MGIKEVDANCVTLQNSMLWKAHQIPHVIRKCVLLGLVHLNLIHGMRRMSTMNPMTVYHALSANTLQAQMKGSVAYVQSQLGVRKSELNVLPQMILLLEHVPLENIHPREFLNAHSVRQANIKMLQGETLVKYVPLEHTRVKALMCVHRVQLVGTKVKTVNPDVLTIQLVLQTKLLLEGQQPLMLIVRSVRMGK